MASGGRSGATSNQGLCDSYNRLGLRDSLGEMQQRRVALAGAVKRVDLRIQDVGWLRQTTPTSHGF